MPLPAMKVGPLVVEILGKFKVIENSDPDSIQRSIHEAKAGDKKAMLAALQSKWSAWALEPK
jgi:hypothetical protein